MTQDLTLLSAPKNYAVVQMAGRNSPGVVVQGDSLHALVSRLQEMQNLLRAGDLEELAAEIESTKEDFEEVLADYETVCLERKINLPYSRK